jgi:hypothetical protein
VLLPENYIPKGVKITEGAISSAINSDDKYNEALKQYNDARGDHEIFKLVVNSLEHKRTALSDMVRLHGQQYFASPETTLTTGERTKLADKREERILERQKRRLKNRKDESNEE